MGRRVLRRGSRKGLSRRHLSTDCKRGRKKGAARKLSKSVEKLFDTFWRFLTFFALRENCRKVSKNFLTLFDDLWRFLTWPLSAGPFCNPLNLEGRSTPFPEQQKKVGVCPMPKGLGSPSPSFLSLFFWKTAQKTTKKTRIFYPYRTPEIPGKEGKNARKNKEFLAGEKNKEFQKNKERKDRVDLAHQNRTIAIASDLRVDWAKSPEIPQKEEVLGSEIAAWNRRSLATFHRTLKLQCGIAFSCFGNRAISGVRDGHRNRKSQKSLRFRCAKVLEDRNPEAP